MERERIAEIAEGLDDFERQRLIVQPVRARRYASVCRLIGKGLLTFRRNKGLVLTEDGTAVRQYLQEMGK